MLYVKMLRQWTQYWKNWSTRDDLVSLAQWESLFGAGFCGLFVFAYNILGDRAPLPYEQLFEFRQKLYGFVAVRLCDYAGFAGPSRPNGTLWRCPPPTSAAWPGRWTNCWASAADSRRAVRNREKNCRQEPRRFFPVSPFSLCCPTFTPPDAGILAEIPEKRWSFARACVESPLGKLARIHAFCKDLPCSINQFGV